MTDREAAAHPKPPHRRWIRATLWIVCGLIVVVSIFLNVRLYHQSIQGYLENSAVRLDPYGLKETEFPADSSPATTLPSAPVVLFFGDSRARGWPAPKVAGYRFVNRGIANQTTEQIRGRFEAHVVPLTPRIVVLQAGINDLKAIPLFPGRRDPIVADCKANLRTIISRARAAGATVIVTTIFPPGDVPLERRPVWSPDIERAVEEVNADLRTLAGDGVAVLDAWKLLESGGKLRGGLGKDTLHLNAGGYEVLNGELAKLLAKP